MDVLIETELFSHFVFLSRNFYLYVYITLVVVLDHGVDLTNLSHRLDESSQGQCQVKTGEKPNVPVAVKLERNKMMVKVTGEGLVLVKDGVRNFSLQK